MRYSAVLASLVVGAALSATVHGESEAVVVELKDNQFHPAELDIRAGETVRWINKERRTSHDVYFPEQGIESGRFFPEESFEHTFEEAGTYDYYCQPHENRGMRGVIRVSE